MSRHSLFVLLFLLFGIVLAAVNSAFILQMHWQGKQEYLEDEKRYHQMVHMLLPAHIRDAPHDLHLPPPPPHEPSDSAMIDYFEASPTTLTPKYFYNKTARYDHREFAVYDIDGKRYIFIKRLGKIYIDKHQGTHIWVYWSILLSLNLILILLFAMFYKKLMPLKRLRKSIHSFAKGDLEHPCTIQGKDEIAEISQEFDAATMQIRQLHESRALFLRNIMHELRTPIAKGKITADLIEEGKNKQRLHAVFDRLEGLLQQFTKIEQLTSGTFELNKNDFRLIDLLDQAMDSLQCEKENIRLQADESSVCVDFELFAIALKSLLDNAIKYSKEKPDVIIKEGVVQFKNSAKKLERAFESYLSPFSRERQISAKGLGSGLYVCNTIVEAHGFTLVHSYSNEGIHCFEISGQEKK